MKKLMWFILLIGLIFIGYSTYKKYSFVFFIKQPIANNIQTKPIQDTLYTFQLFFNNTIKDPNLLDCTHVYPLVRQTKNIITPEFLINELLKGLTLEEKNLGFVTAIPKNCRLNFVTVTNEKAVVDFIPFQIAGSCATAAFTAQIKQTLLALTTIKEVQITIQGKTEEILQP